MIGSLRGKLISKKPPYLVLDVGGVGYELEAPMTTFYDLPETLQEVFLHTHLVVREDAQLLYGFSALSQRELFRSLLKISGVGPRVALALLSALSTQDFVTCVIHEDSTSLTRVPGIGKKTAERLIIEMRDRIESLELVAQTGIVGDPSSAASNTLQDAISALIALGYRASDASKAVHVVEKISPKRDDLIRNALKKLATG